MLTEEESADRFEDADENDDGKVTWEEYKSDAFGSDEEDIHSHEESNVSVFYQKFSSVVNFVISVVYGLLLVCMFIVECFLVYFQLYFIVVRTFNTLIFRTF